MFISVPCPRCKRQFNAPENMQGQKVACPYCAHPYTGIPEIDSRAVTESEPTSPKKPSQRESVDLVEVEAVDLVEVEMVDLPQGSGRTDRQTEEDSDSNDRPKRSGFSWPILLSIVMAILGVAFLVFCLIYALNKK
jgi:hypothetical protein